jgi:hypothetical protein
VNALATVVVVEVPFASTVFFSQKMTTIRK